jgi:hypothetical protein
MQIKRVGILLTWGAVLCLGGLFLLAAPLTAGEADVIAVVARCNADSTCSFAVTLKHGDKGWDHFADRWEVVDGEGKVLATRVLRHPHVDEQPFTRSLSGVEVPKALERVTIRGRDSVDGYGGRELEIELKRPGESRAPAAQPSSSSPR